MSVPRLAVPPARLAAAALAIALGACQEKGAASPAQVASPAPAQAVAAAPPNAAARVETAEYTVALDAKAAEGTITVTAKAPLHINPDYPMAFRPEGATVTFEGPKVPLSQETKTPCAGKPEETCQSVSALKYAGASAGAKVAGTVLFSVCQPEKCLMEKVPLAAAVP